MRLPLNYSLFAYPELISFPTRRSSDLHDKLVAVLAIPLHDFIRRGVTIAVDRVGVGVAFVPTCYRLGARHSVQDRKSTRLNSSHFLISYAVFCLKKKRLTLLEMNRLDS